MKSWEQRYKSAFVNPGRFFDIQRLFFNICVFFIGIMKNGKVEKMLRVRIYCDPTMKYLIW